MQALNLKLALNVPDSRMTASLVSLVYERLKRATELLDKTSILEINLSHKDNSGNEPIYVAEIRLVHSEGKTHEICESKEWDVAFYNALDKVADTVGCRIEKSLPELMS